MEQVDIVIIGAGVIGLAAACRLAERWPDKDIIVLEKNPSFGQDMSARTSEVIHSGAFYPPGSLKAQLCTAGNPAVYAFCERWHVPHERLGKLIIARDSSETEALARLYRQAGDNGITDAVLLSKTDIADYEPHICAEQGIYVPSSGIVDTHRMMQAMEQAAAEGGVMLAYGHTVTAIQAIDRGYEITYQDEAGQVAQLACRAVINAAGLFADQVAAMVGIPIDEAGYRIYRCKGEYFAVHNEKASYVQHLVYPVSIRELKGSGLPVIKDLNGRLRLGPDAHYASANYADYSVYSGNATAFWSIANAYLPFLTPADLVPDMAALRARLLVPCGSPPRDFIICHETERQLTGFVNLIGVESPGFTCCFSMAERVGDMLATIW